MLCLFAIFAWAVIAWLLFVVAFFPSSAHFLSLFLTLCWFKLCCLSLLSSLLLVSHAEHSACCKERASQTFTEAPPALPGGLCSADKSRNIYFYYAEWICHSAAGSVTIASAWQFIFLRFVQFESFLIERRCKNSSPKMFHFCRLKCPIMLF